MGFLDWLLGKETVEYEEKPLKIWFPFYILEKGDKTPQNKWFQKETAKNKSFVNYRGSWSRNWKYANEYGDSIVKVAGISKGDRAEYFLKIAQSEDFKMYLEDDPSNPVNKNARKVMTSGTVDDEFITKHVGYLPDDVTNEYAGIELKISPKSLFIPPTEGFNFGLEVALLKRSVQYLKKANAANNPTK